MLKNVSSRKGLSLIVIIAVSVALAIYFVQGITSNIPATNKEILNLASDTNLDVDAVFTSDGNTALLPTTSHLYIIDIASGNNIKLINLASDTMPGVDVVFTADDMIAVLPTTSHLYMIEIPSGGIREVINLASDTNTDVDVVITADGNTALLPTTSHLYIIDIPSGNIKALINLASNTQKCVDVMITPDGNTALLPTTSHLYIIDIPSGNIKELINLASDTNLEVDLRITPDGNTALLPTTSHLYIIDVSSGNIQTLLNLASNTMPGVDIVITPEGNTAFLPTISHLYMIDVSSGNIQTLLNLASSTMPGVDIVVTPDGNTALLPTISHLYMIDVSSGNIQTLLNLASNTMKGVDIVVTPEGNTAFLPTTSHLYMIDVSSGNIQTLLNLASDTNLDIDLEIVCPIISSLPGSIAILPTKSHLYIIDDLPQDNVLLPTISHLYMLNVQSCNIKELLNLASDTMRGVDVVIARNILIADPDEDFPELPTSLHHEEKLIFSIEAGELEKDLDEGSVPERLKEKFEAEHIPLSEDVIVTKSGDGEWTITDKEKEYIVRKKDGMIDVYTPTEPVITPHPDVESRSDNFNHIKIQTEPQIVLIGQNLQFDGFTTPPTVYRLVSGYIENMYPAEADYRIYNVNWPTSGAYYVNYRSSTDYDARLFVDEVNMPLKIKVGTKEVSCIVVGTPITLYTGGMNLFPEDVVDLKIIDPDGNQIKTDENNQTFTGKTLSYLRDHYGNNNLNTTGWTIGAYTLQIKTKPEYACGLEAKSNVQELKIIKGPIDIDADKTSVAELERIKLTVTGVTGHKITINTSDVAHTTFPGGVNDNPDKDCSDFSDVIDADGTRTYAVEFNDTGSYTITATDKDTGEYDDLDITVSEKDVTFDMPTTVVIGEKLSVKGHANTGDWVQVAVDDIICDRLKKLVIDENGEFEKEIDTSKACKNVFAAPGSLRLKAFIDGTYPEWEDVSKKTDDGSIALLMARGDLKAELSVTSVAWDDKFIISGLAKGSKEVNILIVAPKGSSGDVISGASGDGMKNTRTDGTVEETNIYYKTTSVSTTDDTFSKKVDIGDDVDTGSYLVILITPGPDGKYGKYGHDKLVSSATSAFARYYFAAKTQEEVLEIIRDAISVTLSDDLKWIGYIKVESPYVRLDPIADVGIGEPLVVTGTSNREEGFVIVVTVKGEVELTPQTVGVENGTFTATFDTTDAKVGTYAVKADDGDGHTDEATVEIGEAVPPSEP